MRTPRPSTIIGVKGAWSVSLPILGLLALTLLVLPGCATGPFARPAAPAYKPVNVFRYPAPFPAEMKRVAVLPLAVEGDQHWLVSGRTALEPILRSELGRTLQFEFVFPPEDWLKRATGRPGWTGREKLPPDFFAKLRDTTGCDAVLFCELTEYRPYPPLAVGWRFKLVDAGQPLVWWSADELFEATNPEVAAGAKRWSLEEFWWHSQPIDSETILRSPQQFGGYSARLLLATLKD
jgi:hypothetical protein